ncbi:galactose oxidase [Rhizophagus irregularis]|uniref:Galactose oxidase n=1 Tax=Rhizophagus irregularis TaxID=588596 RepID=A0A2I1DVQ8_9GLOM|nr:galactose oxidase [Rhizophagus irregularis]PKC67626.1 galactose oxidase [Rhizophagus irregularis]PKY13951.1 galactose oxidase [Rhizophagus irregularis]CAB4495219.1 unnamed protein product [Rhizophagus irregularis]CAB5093660.1 unnamed protein product [Rhizophagus irregularis]
MCKSLKHHNYHLILIIILYILNVYGQYVPGNRYGHSAVFVRSEQRIYFIGGFKAKTYVPNPMSDVFYLNVNEFTDLTSQVNLPLTLFHVSELGGVNKDLIFTIGGVNLNDPETNHIYSLNTKTNELSVPIVQGKVPPTRTGMSSVIYEGKIYLFGGRASVNAFLYFNNFDIFDTINLNWQVGSLVNSPIARAFHSSTLVNGVIYYIGGTQINDYPPLTEIYQYDIVGNTWSLKKATAADPKFMPGSRACHTSILMHGKIVIYGGFFSSSDIQNNLPAKETIAMLDVNTLVWSIPEFDARVDNPIPKLALHTATVMGEIMYIAFGNFMDEPNGFDQTNKDIYLFFFGDPQIFSVSLSLIINSTNEAQPQIPTSTNTNINPQQPSSLSKVVIVGISIGSVSLVLTILSVLSIAHYKRTKKSKVQLGGVPNDPNSVEINDDKSHSEYQQQDPPTILTESP